MADDGGPKTLRDEFAGEAMNALLPNVAVNVSAIIDKIVKSARIKSIEELTELSNQPELRTAWKGAFNGLAEQCYQMADSMLAERNKTSPPRDPSSPLWGEETK